MLFRGLNLRLSEDELLESLEQALAGSRVSSRLLLLLQLEPQVSMGEVRERRHPMFLCLVRKSLAVLLEESVKLLRIEEEAGEETAV